MRIYACPTPMCMLPHMCTPSHVCVLHTCTTYSTCMQSHTHIKHLRTYTHSLYTHKRPLSITLHVQLCMFDHLHEVTRSRDKRPERWTVVPVGVDCARPSEAAVVNSKWHKIKQLNVMTACNTVNASFVSLLRID